MKTFDNFYDEAIALPNLYNAYNKAKQGKTDAIFLQFCENLHENLWRLHEELASQTYQPSGYTVFYVDDYKRRRIMAPHFRDHVMQHALFNYLEQIYDSVFIYDSFACRKGKGTHKGFFRLKKAINKHSGRDYFMKCDVSKYFYSIDQYKLISIIRKKIKDEKVLWLIEKLIGSHNEDEIPAHIPNPNHKEQRKGIPIGNLMSQLFANIYLNELDYFVKHKLRVKHYFRYVDDFVILAKDKNELHHLWKEIHSFAEQHFLKIEPRKTSINKISFGVDFLGYVGFKRYTRVRTRNYKRFKARLKIRINGYRCGEISLESLNSTFISYLGHLSHTNSDKIRENVKSEFIRFNVAAASSAGPLSAAGTGTMGRMPAPFARTSTMSRPM